MISYRKITIDDYKDVCDISKDIWDGTDYIPYVFEKWVKDKGYFLGAIDSDNNKIIGIGKYSILHDKSGWLEGLRVHKNYRGLKIARGISETLLAFAKKELSEGKIKRIGFGTHESNVESISLMKKLNFKIKQEFIIIEGSKDMYTGINFEVKPWHLSFEDFRTLEYFKARSNIIPLAFVFEEPTLELYNEFKENNSFITINGYNGIFKIKGEPNFIAVDDSFEAIDVFMQYSLMVAKNKNLPSPFTSILPHSLELIKELKSNGYKAWSNWQPDYFYFIYE